MHYEQMFMTINISYTHTHSLLAKFENTLSPLLLWYFSVDKGLFQTNLKGHFLSPQHALLLDSLLSVCSSTHGPSRETHTVLLSHGISKPDVI